MLQNNTILITDSQIISKLVDGEMILLHPVQGKVRVLNTVGARIWELIDGTRSVQWIIDIICSEFDVTAQTAREDCNKFIDSLIEAKLVRSK